MQRTRPFVGHVVIFVSDGGSNAARDTSFGGAGVGQPSTLREVRDVNGGGGFVVLGLGGLGAEGGSGLKLSWFGREVEVVGVDREGKEQERDHW